MKKMLLFGLCFIFVFCIISCNTSSPSVISEDYLSVIKEFQNSCKDPKSFRIYGDIYTMKTENPTLVAVFIEYDAKNGFGAYNGKEPCLIIKGSDGSIGWAEEDEDGFMNLKSMYESFENGEFEELFGVESQGDNIISKLNGEDIAKIINAEYFD